MNKTEIITEIRAIYRDLGYQSRGKALEEFSPAQLQAHLDRLRGGEHGWMKPQAPRRHAAPA